MKQVKLFCFPYAGGSSLAYKHWERNLSSSIELIPIEYSGRGKRFSTPPFEDISDIVEDIFYTVQKHLEPESCYSFFGHSMGALIAYELIHKLYKLDYPSPIHMFFSGRLAPHIENQYKNLHTLDDTDFKEELLKLGGTPKEALASKPLMKLFLPILKSDFKAVEKYNYSKKDKILNCDFTILYGEDDHLTNNKIYEWQQHTQNNCTFLKFSGGHFFINDHADEIINIINNTLMSKFLFI